MRFSHLLAILALSFSLGTLALTTLINHARADGGELDHEGSVTNVDKKAAGAALPATIVVRTDTTNNTRAIIHTDNVLPADASSHALLNDAAFISVSATDRLAGQPKNELDRDSSTNSWFFYFDQCNWYRPAFYYYGYNYFYTPYYSYNYGTYAYSYYWYR